VGVLEKEGSSQGWVSAKDLREKPNEKSTVKSEQRVGVHQSYFEVFYQSG